MSKEVRTAADLERHVCERMWEVSADGGAVKRSIGDLRKTMHYLVHGRRLEQGPSPGMHEVRAEAMNDAALFDWKPTHPDRTYAHPNAAPLPSRLNDPALTGALERQLGIPLADASPLLLRSLQRAMPLMNPELLPRIADAVRTNSAHGNALLLALSRAAEDDAARENLLAFAAHPESGKIFDLYAHIAEASFDHEVRRADIQRSIGQNTRLLLRPELTMRRASMLLRMSERLTREHGTGDPKRLRTALGLVRDALWQTNETEQVVGDVLKSMPKEKWSGVQLDTLEGVDFLPAVRIKDIPDERQKAEILKHMIASFKDCETDIRALAESDDGYVTAAFCGNELIASIATTRLPSGVLHFDYLCMNKRSELRGLTEAMVVQGLRAAKKELGATDAYCVAKPQIRALQNQIENMGFVGYDLSGPEEPGTYIRCRQTATEYGKYVTKALSADEVGDIVTGVREPNKVYRRTIGGKKCLAALVIYEAGNVEGATKDPANGWTQLEPADLPAEQQRMYDWIEQYRGRYVLTRYVPLYGAPDTYGGAVQMYGAIFEPVAITPAEAEAFEKGLTEA